MKSKVTLQESDFEKICAIAHKIAAKKVPAAVTDEATLQLILEQHRAGMCSIEETIGRAYRLGRSRGGR